MTVPLPICLLSGALVDPAWLGTAGMSRACALPGFTRVAARAKLIEVSPPHDQASPEPGDERWLAHWLELPVDCPLAACGTLADRQIDAHWRIDPVHLHVGRDHLVLTDPATLALDDADAQALAQAIAPLLADEGLALHVPVANRWTLVETDPERPLRLLTRSLVGALGRNIDARMPTGADARRWRRLVNEVQMTWHAHPVNERRESLGLPTVNSLWIEGRVPGPATDPWADIWTLAGRIALRDRSAQASPHRFERPQAHGVARLDLDDRLMQAGFSGDPQAWLQAWALLDAQLFMPMAAGLAPWKDGAQLVLSGDAGWRHLLVAPRSRWWPLKAFDRRGLAPQQLLFERPVSQGLQA